MWFESLEKDWEREWEVGQVILGMFLLDDEI